MDNGGSDWKHFPMLCCQDPETRCVMRGGQVPLVETEGCFDNLKAKQCTERWMTSGGSPPAGMAEEDRA